VHVAYDHQIFGWQEYGGISRYFFEIAKRIQTFDECEVEILAPLFVNRYLKESSTLLVRGRYVQRLPKTTRVIQGINSRIVRSMLRKAPPDVIHETYYLEKKLAPSRTRTAITVYDMTHERYPQFFAASDETSKRKRAAVERADHVICISENTRSDLIELFGIERRKTSVIHLAASSIRSTKSQVPRIIDGPYVAYVGLRHGYKNFSGLLRAVASSEYLRTNFCIVCVGGEAFTSADRDEVERLHLKKDRVIHLKAEDDVLAAVYRDAAVFVYPTLNEGFGLPPLEAMSAGCPVACAQKGSLPEVCGDAAEYFDPNSPESIAAAIERAVSSPARRQELVGLGQKQIQKFSWDTCARKTAAVYYNLL